MKTASRSLPSFVALVGLAAALGLAAPPVRAQSADDATRAAARTLGYEGISDFQAGNYAAAADKLDRAYQALKVPSLGLWSARAFDKTGKLVAASERYLEVQRLDTSGGDVAVQKQAQADAESDHAALVPRIPSVVIALEGAPAAEVTLTVNGVAMPSSLVGVKRLVDPGTVSIEGKTSAGATATESVSLNEGETKTVTLHFVAGPTPLPIVPVVTTVKPTNDPTDKPAPASGSGLRTPGFIVLAAGGAGLVVGAVTGGIAMSKRSSMNCEGTNCPTSETDNVASYNQLRTISSVSFIAGGALAAAGLVMVLTAPSSTPAKTASARSTLRLSPWLGAESAGLALEVER